MVFIVFSGNLVQPLVKNNCGGLIIDGLVIVGVMVAFRLYRAVALVFPDHGNTVPAFNLIGETLADRRHIVRFTVFMARDAHHNGCRLPI